MAPTPAAESPRSARAKAKGVSSSGQRVVPVVPLKLTRSSAKKKVANSPGSNVSSSPQPTLQYEGEVNGNRAPTPTSSSNTGNQLASEPANITDNAGVNFGESGHGNSAEADRSRLQEATQHPRTCELPYSSSSPFILCFLASNLTASRSSV